MEETKWNLQKSFNIKRLFKDAAVGLQEIKWEREVSSVEKSKIMVDGLSPSLRASPWKDIADKFTGSWRYRVALPAQGLLFDLFRHGQFKADGCTFEIPKILTSRRLRGSCFDGSYELPERALVREFVQPQDSVIELGACLGVVSCVTNARLRDKSRHLVVEANPQCIPAIHKNRETNGCAFKVENCAASNQREVSLFLDPANLLSATLKTASKFPVTVPGCTLSELCRRHGPFSVLIMDIEGSELEVLESSAEILQGFRLIIVELHDTIIGTNNINRCREILSQAGLSLVGKSIETEAWLRMEP